MGGETTTTVQAMRITCPAGWRDASLLVVTADAPGASGVTPTLVVSKEAIADGQSLDRAARLLLFVDAQLAKMRASLGGFALMSRRDPTADRATAELRIRWASGGVPVMQSVLYAFADDAKIITSTATAGNSDFDDLEPTFRSMLQGFRTV